MLTTCRQFPEESNNAETKITSQEDNETLHKIWSWENIQSMYI